MRYKQPYTIFKRGKYWYYRTYNSIGVRTTARSTGQTNKAAALNFCSELFKYDKLMPPPSVKAYDYFKHFCDADSVFVRDRTVPLAESSLKSYKSIIDNNILDSLGNLSLEDITYTWLKNFRANCLEKYSVNTTKTTMMIFKKVILMAYSEDLIVKNPFENLGSIHTDMKVKRDSFTFDELKLILADLPPEHFNFSMLMILTGMRVSEAYGVTLQDIRESNGIRYIYLDKQLKKGKYLPLKTKDSRIIPIIPELEEIILPVAIWSYRTAMQKAFSKCADAKERKLSIHSFRHYFITASKSYGINSNKVEKIAGHRLKGIEDVYTNFKAEDLKDILIWQKDLFDKLKR